MSETGFRLHYFVRLRPESSPEHLKQDLNAAFRSLDELARGNAGAKQERASDVRVSFNSSLGCYVVAVVLSVNALGLDSGGMARLLSSLFGNQFRHESVEWASLYSIEPLPGIGTYVSSPAVGLDSIHRRTGNVDQPVFSVPLPRGLRSDDEKSLTSALIGAGVGILTQSPFTTTLPGELERIANDLDALANAHRRHVMYFVNATSKLQFINGYLRELPKLKREHVTMGLRICPLSIGLNVCSWIRTTVDCPIYGYNLLPLGQPLNPSYEVTPQSVATLLRLSGVDAVNAGLKYETFSKGTSVQDFVSACREPLTDNIATTLPMLTGGITPRLAYTIVRSHGLDVGLHIKKPLLKFGLQPKTLKGTMDAYREAVAIALSGQDLDDAVANEASNTKALRAYERASKA